MELIQNIDKLILDLFWDITDNGNYLLLDVNYNKENKYNKDDHKLAYETWLKLWDEYFELEKSTKNKNYLLQKKKQVALLYQMVCIENLRDTLVYLYENKDVLDNDLYMEYEAKFYSIAKLYAPNFKPLYFEGVPVNVSNLDRLLRSLDTTYKIRYKKEEKATETQKQNRYSEIVSVGQIVGQRLNPKEIFVSEWLQWKKTAKDILELKTK